MSTGPVSEEGLKKICAELEGNFFRYRPSTRLEVPWQASL